MKLPTFLIDRQFRIARRWSNEELKRLAPSFSGKIVNVSAWKDQDKEGRSYREYFTNAESYSLTNFGGANGHQGTDEEILLDLSKPLPDALKGAFDVCFNHTTLEHIFDVNTAFTNICQMSSDTVVVVLPFAQRQHESDTWKDYWRFTPSWVREAFAQQGFEVLYLSSNNQRNAAVYVFAIASRHPERWAGKLPIAAHENMAASWIGRSRWRSAVSLVATKLGITGRK